MVWHLRLDMVTEVKVGPRLQIPHVAMTVPRVGILHEVPRPRS